MEMNSIDVFTFITRNSSKYAEFLKYTCEHYASGAVKINWKCIESVGVDALPNGFECVARAGDAGHNSMNHAIAMNLAQKYIESDYVVFVDADVAILYNNWDKVIIDRLSYDDCFGGGYANGIKYRNFPTVYLFAFRKSILDKVVLDFSPKISDGIESPVRIALSKDEAGYYGMNAGEVIKCDTGWRLPKILKSAGFTGGTMPMVKMKSGKRILPFVDKHNKEICMKNPTHMCEWHYKNKLFATHKQASRNHPIDGEFGKAWKERVEAYIEGVNN